MTIMNAPLRHAGLACAVVAALAMPGALPAAADGVSDAAPAAASAAVEQRVRAELQSVVSGLIESGALGATQARDLHLEVDSPARQVTNLGLLVDGNGAHDGVRVLGVTPGGAAEKIGVRSGDVVVAVGGESLVGMDAAAAVLRRHVDAVPDQGAIVFDVRRDGRVETLRGTLSSTYVPAMHLTIGNAIAATALAGAGDGATAAATGCGRIGDFDVAPRQQSLHAAKIIGIDGVTPGPQGSHSFRVTAGRHVVKVSEQIEAKYLPFNDRLRNAGMAQSRYKTIEVDVAPDTTSLIAARLIEDQRTQWKDGAYWEPVAWKRIGESCR